VVFQYDLEGWLLVSWKHDEAGEVGRDPIVLAGREFNLLDAGFVATLAVEGERFLDTVLFRALLDPLVDGAENLFVMCSSVCEIHLRILPRRSDHDLDRRP